MLTHLIILLDDTSVSYCHYSNANERRLIGLDDLKAGLVWAMKENVNVQFAYPDYELPYGNAELIDSVDHTNIKPECLAADADVTVLEHWKVQTPDVDANAVCLLRASRRELAEHADNIKAIMQKASRRLQQKMAEKGIRLNPSHEIREIDYLDPFNIVNRWK